MNFSLFIRLFFCICILAGFLYGYIENQNIITKLRLKIPYMMTSLKELQRGNERLIFLINHFESPENLFEIASSEEFSYLHFIPEEQVIKNLEDFNERP